LVENPGPSNHNLFAAAWNTPYEYFVPNDDNRAQDGLDLRGRFERETSITLPNLGKCTMLEFLVALSIRMNETVFDFEDPDQVSDWFWELIENLEVDRFDLEEIFQRLNGRKYDYDGGNGGLFPLENPREDQREIEVWYQMMAYLRENL
jgi:hypothetical protein